MRWGAHVATGWALGADSGARTAAEEDRARDAAGGLDGIRRFAAIQTGVPPEDENGDAPPVAAKSVSVPSTPERGPRAQPSAPATPQSEAPVSFSVSGRSPLREARSKGPLSVSVPASPLDGARIRRQESLEKMKRELEEDDAKSTRNTKTKEARSRALFADEGDSADDGDSGSGAVAAVAAGVSAGMGESDPSPPPRATARWLRV